MFVSVSVSPSLSVSLNLSASFSVCATQCLCISFVFVQLVLSACTVGCNLHLDLQNANCCLLCGGNYKVHGGKGFVGVVVEIERRKQYC